MRPLGRRFRATWNSPSRCPARVTQIPIVKQFVPNPVKLPFAEVPLPNVDTGKIPILIGQPFNFLQCAASVAGSLGCSVSSLTTSTTTVSVNGESITFDPGRQQVTVSVGASASTSLESSLSLSVSGWLHSATSGTVLPASARLAASVTPINVSQSQCFQSYTGSVQVNNDNSIAMTTGSAASPGVAASPSASIEPADDSPNTAWLTTVVTSSSAVSALLFDAQFNPSDTCDSVLSVYLAGNLIGLVDEAAAGGNEESYLLPLDDVLPAGTYQLSYRLDPLGSDACSVVILDSNLVAVPEPSTFALLLTASFGLVGLCTLSAVAGAAR